MAYRVQLSQDEENALREIVQDNKHKPNVLKRAYCILLKNEGQRNENIQRLLGIHEDSIADWTRLYLKRGIKGLINFRYHERRKSKLHPYKQRIRRMAAGKKTSTVEELQKKIKQNLNIDVEYSWLYRYCKKYDIYPLLRKHKQK